MEEEKNFAILKHFDENWKKVFPSINKMYSVDNGVFFATEKVLHFWGQFTGELPQSFQPNGPVGHQYIICKSTEEAEKKCQELRSAIFKLWPDSAEWAGKGWYRWMIHDGRQMDLRFEKAKTIK